MPKLRGNPSRQPLLLPQKHRLTDLIVEDAHLKLLHGKSQLMISGLRSDFWILNMRKAVRRCTFKYITCTRHRARTVVQQMETLPPARVQQARVFLTTGVDYGGPFTVKSSAGRGAKHHKAYLALFVCFATKAAYHYLCGSSQALHRPPRQAG